MKWFIFIIATMRLGGGQLYAQRVVFDRKHFQAVTENNAVQSAAEVTHNRFLTKIDQDLKDICTDAGSVVLAQTLIDDGLSSVNSALKNGIAVRDMGVLVADLVNYSAQMASLAKAQPYLLLFAEHIGREMKIRAAALLTDVTRTVLKSDGKMLADYNSRDELLRRVTVQLQILNGLAYGAWRAMYWAKEQGLIHAINPFAGFISGDRQFVQDILRNTKYLKP
jgi:hypothetical protein